MIWIRSRLSLPNELDRLTGAARREAEALLRAQRLQWFRS